MPQPLNLVLVVDGLRPDSINITDTPHIDRLRRSGTNFSNTHAALPPVTRVNAAVLATGMHPAATGILGNRVVLPMVKRSETVSLNDPTNLDRVRDATGRIVQTPTLAERLDRTGRHLVVVGSGSGGTTLSVSPAAPMGVGTMISCDDPTAPGSMAYPESLETDVLSRFGPPPSKTTPGDKSASVEYATRVLVDYVLPELQPDVALLWMTEPDGAQHAHHVGSSQARSSLRHVDTCIGLVLDRLQDLGLRDDTNILVVSDHGFTAKDLPCVDVTAELVSAGLKTDADSTDVIVANNGCLALHVEDGPEQVRKVVEFLQQQQWSDTIFTRADRPGATSLETLARGWVEGTFSLESIHVASDTVSPDILVSPRWSSNPNAFGTSGTTGFAHGVKPSGHGSLSPWDITSTFIASGPGFKRGMNSSTPMGNVDLVPTLLALLDADDDLDDLDGRPVLESFAGGPDPCSVPVENHTLVAETPDGSYRAALRVSCVADTRYIDGSQRL